MMIMNIEDLYQREVGRWSDIYEHLPTFVDLVKKTDAQDVLELGVRFGTSTVAWLYGLQQTGGNLWSVDIVDQVPPEIYEAAGHNWTFLIDDDMGPTIGEKIPRRVDIVFIDTSHEYQHTYDELTRYANHVRTGGCIVLHDTNVETFDHHPPGSQRPFPVRSAVEDWLTNMDPQKRIEKETWLNSYGLTVLWML